VIFEVIAGIYLFPAIREVWIFAILLRPAARKMLRHRRDRFWSELFALESVDVGLHQSAGQICIFAETAADPRPAGLRCKIDLRMQGQAKTHGEVFLPSDVCKAFHELSGANRREAKGFRPLGECASSRRRSHVLGEVVTRVCRQGDRDAKPGACSERLQAVVPLRKGSGVLGRAYYIEVAEQLVLDHVLSAFHSERRASLSKIT
jgi:hypothetical protein